MAIALGLSVLQWLCDRWDIGGEVTRAVLTIDVNEVVTLEVTRLVQKEALSSVLEQMTTTYELMPRSPDDMRSE